MNMTRDARIAGVNPRDIIVTAQDGSERLVLDEAAFAAQFQVSETRPYYEKR